MQLPLGMIKSKATHILWPPSRRQRLEPIPNNERIVSDIEPTTDQEQDALSLIPDHRTDVRGDRTGGVAGVVVPVVTAVTLGMVLAIKNCWTR